MTMTMTMMVAMVVMLNYDDDGGDGGRVYVVRVQANDDLRQEQFVSHLVAVFDQIFKAAKLGVRLRPYEIMATSLTAGVIEVGIPGQEKFELLLNCVTAQHLVVVRIPL